jgi:hypothetical protein
MHIYTSWPTILLNMKAIRQAVTEEKPWQEQDWRTDRRTDSWTAMDRWTGQKHYTPRNFVAWGIIMDLHVLPVEYAVLLTQKSDIDRGEAEVNILFLDQ